MPNGQRPTAGMPRSPSPDYIQRLFELLSSGSVNLILLPVENGEPRADLAVACHLQYLTPGRIRQIDEMLAGLTDEGQLVLRKRKGRLRWIDPQPSFDVVD